MDLSTATKTQAFITPYKIINILMPHDTSDEYVCFYRENSIIMLYWTFAFVDFLIIRNSSERE